MPTSEFRDRTPLPAALAGLIVAVDLAKLVVLWTFPLTWARVAAALSVSPTTLAAGSTIIITLGLIATVRPLTLLRRGWSRRHLEQAFAAGIIVWLVYQVGAFMVTRVASFDDPATVDVSVTWVQAVLVGYSEELVYRVVAFGGIFAVALRRMSAQRAVWMAGAGAVALFVIGHVPHDVVMLEGGAFTRYGGLVLYGGLLMAVYIRTGNLALVATLHALSNQPLLLHDPGRTRAMVEMISLAACIAILVTCRPGTTGTAPEQDSL